MLCPPRSLNALRWFRRLVRNRELRVSLSFSAIPRTLSKKIDTNGPLVWQRLFCTSANGGKTLYFKGMTKNAIL
jgi:hypothetical protein